MWKEEEREGEQLGEEEIESERERGRTGKVKTKRDGWMDEESEKEKGEPKTREGFLHC